jgi:DNA-binding transcriptional ArsR family regulator
MKPKNNPIDFANIAASVDRACRLLKVLANPDRLLLLCRISEGESCVRDLEESLEICQPTLSQQLSILREEGLVTTRREGKRIFYSLASPESIAVITTLQEQFCKPCHRIQD